jgi:hypothetical protein
VLRPHLRRVYCLEDLVKRMTPRNMHKELGFGGPMVERRCDEQTSNAPVTVNSSWVLEEFPTGLNIEFLQMR